jgi:hypothetical protein
MNDKTIDNETGEVIGDLVQVQEVNPAVAAEINQQVATARRFPRRRDKEIADEIFGRATLNEEIASECIYSLKRGEKDIIGPSIRFAEIVRASFGNIRVAARFVRLDVDDPERGAVIVEAACLDVQTNNSEIIPVRRSVMTSASGGRKPRLFNADMINMTVNAASSIARRNAIFAVVPKAVWIAGFQRAVQVVKGDATTLAQRRAELIAAFGRVGIKPAQLFAAIDVKDENDITLEHMPQIVGMMTAIKEGENPESVVGRQTAEPAREGVRNPLADEPAAVATSAATAKPAAEQVAKGGESGNAPQTAREGQGPAVQQPGAELPLGDGKPTPDAAAKPEPAKTADAGPAKPATPTEYASMAMARIEGAGAGIINAAMKAKTADELQTWWKKDRATRIGLKLPSEVLEPLQEAYERKLDELRGRPAEA